MSKIRIFVKQNEHDNSFEVLRLINEQIRKVVCFSEGENVFAVPNGEEHNIDSYKDLGGMTVDEDELDKLKILYNEELTEKFKNYLMEHFGYDNFCSDEEEITEKEIEEELEKIKLMDSDTSCDPIEIFSFWDGSNHRQIELNTECSDWTEVEEDELNDYTIKEWLAKESKGTYEIGIAITNSGKKVEIEDSFMQGTISKTWRILEDCEQSQFSLGRRMANA